jgi:G:T/U-mismatch repair DNA glycosylase
MRTIHNFINKYPIATDSKKLILGTIHPHDIDAFQLPFFYGNKLSLWKILNEAFPFELKKPLTVSGITAFLNSRKIAISDTILECTRKNNSALDKDLIPEKLNLELKSQLSNSDIIEIYFTSGFGKNNAFKLFYEDILGFKITKDIKSNKSVVIPKSLFGREILCRVLISPSGSANISLSISQEYLNSKHKYQNSKRPVQDFKVDCYKKVFTNNNQVEKNSVI